MHKLSPPDTARATPPVWHAAPQRLAIRDRICHVESADGTLVAIVVDNLGEPGQAISLAEQMAAAPELIERLGDLLTDVDQLTRQDPTHYEVANVVALSALRARQLLTRLAGGPR